MSLPDYYVIGITWIAGAVVLIGILCFFFVLAAMFLKIAVQASLKHTLMLARLSTARYWMLRMEKEGLTICGKEYRRMVADRKPKSNADFASLESDYHKAKQRAQT